MEFNSNVITSLLYTYCKQISMYVYNEYECIPKIEIGSIILKILKFTSLTNSSQIEGNTNRGRCT